MPMQLAFGEQFRIAPLPQDLIASDRDRIREVQRPRLVDHRDPHAAVGIPHQDVLRDTARFLAEDDVRAVGVGDLAVDMPRLGGEEKVFSAFCFFKEIVDTVVVGDVDEIPVVESRAFEVAVGDLKAERTHQMQSGAGGGAGAGDVAGVLRDLGLKYHDIENLFVFQILSPLSYCNRGTIRLQALL